MAVNRYIDKEVYKRTNFVRLPGPVKSLCLLCDATLDDIEVFLCRACAADLPVNRGPCPTCGLPDTFNQPCAYCIKRSVPFTGTMALYRYEYPVNRLIQLMKFHARLDIARFMGKQMAVQSVFKGNLPECLIPVPLHARRLAGRGFNQALEVARSASESIGVPVLSGCIRRSIATRAQTELPAKQRKRNMQGAFEWVHSGALKYHHVAIVDDVVTTGATVMELAGLLRGSGISQVDIWACARAIL